MKKALLKVRIPSAAIVLFIAGFLAMAAIPLCFMENLISKSTEEQFVKENIQLTGRAGIIPGDGGGIPELRKFAENIDKISAVACNVSDCAKDVSSTVKVQNEMVEEIPWKVNKVSVLSKELKSGLNVFKMNNEVFRYGFDTL